MKNSRLRPSRAGISVATIAALACASAATGAVSAIIASSWPHQGAFRQANDLCAVAFRGGWARPASLRPGHPQRSLASQFCCDAHRCPLVGFVLDGQFCMRRRNFIALLGGAATAWPLAAHAQTSGKTYRIGFLGVFSYAEYRRLVDALLMGLRQLGYDEGKNIVIHYRWAEGRYDRLPELAAELVKLNVDVLVTHSTPGSRAAKQATSTVPIVMAAVSDPVDTGLVVSLA